MTGHCSLQYVIIKDCSSIECLPTCKQNHLFIKKQIQINVLIIKEKPRFGMELAFDKRFKRDEGQLFPTIFKIYIPSLKGYLKLLFTPKIFW